MLVIVKMNSLNPDWFFIGSKEVEPALQTHAKCCFDLTRMIAMAAHVLMGLFFTKEYELGSRCGRDHSESRPRCGVIP
jgi:hypothetical protein